LALLIARMRFPFQSLLDSLSPSRINGGWKVFILYETQRNMLPHSMIGFATAATVAN
jgi:hypothetical protein